MWSESLLVLLCFSYIPTFADKVYWLPNRSIKLPYNFDDGMLPCPGQNIVFPETVEESVLISGLSISGLILPIDGEIVLGEEGIVFGSDDDSNCTRDGNSYYRDAQILSWDQPDVWSSSRFNDATPDAERIPCQDDTVLFPKNGQFSVQLPVRPQTIKIVKEAETERVLNLEDLIHKQSNDDSQHFIESEPGMLKVSSEKWSYSRPCLWTSPGCPCQEYGLEIDCKVKYCAPPRCLNPIKPEGHCCELCGASLTIQITKDFNMKSFKESVSKIIESYGADKFSYHVGLLPQKYHVVKESDEVQVIVLDKGEYTGVCKQVITDINYMLSKDGVKGHRLLFSGNPSSESGSGGKIVVIVFFLVVVLIGSLFVYYYRSLSTLRELRGGMTRDMLSRLQRRTESVMSLARRDSTVSTATASGTDFVNPMYRSAERAQGESTAFRNPMYSSLRERAQVQEAVDEE